MAQVLTGPARPRPAQDRFWEKVEKTDACWIWRGSLKPCGYGQFAVSHKNIVLAHRFAYENAVGPIPEGLTIDHLCRNQLCVNPAHLEAVTQRENNLRGNGWAGRNGRKTHCKRGHAFDAANTLIPRGTNHRECRTCIRENRKRRQRALAQSKRPEVTP